MPPGSGAKLARAVPFALEEQLTEDIDQLVFALGKRRRPAAARPWRSCRAPCCRDGSRSLPPPASSPTAIYADISLMPENPGQTVLWLERSSPGRSPPRRAAVRRGTHPVKEALMVAGVIADPLAATSERAARPRARCCTSRARTGRTSRRRFEALVEQFASTEDAIAGRRSAALAVAQLGSPDAVNLLQGEFARGTDYGAQLAQMAYRGGTRRRPCS